MTKSATCCKSDSLRRRAGGEAATGCESVALRTAAGAHLALRATRFRLAGSLTFAARRAIPGSSARGFMPVLLWACDSPESPIRGPSCVDAATVQSALAARSCRAFRRRRNAEILAAPIEEERWGDRPGSQRTRSSVAALGSVAAGTCCVRRVSGSQCRSCSGRSSSSSRDCSPPAPNSCATSAPRPSQMVKPTASNVRTFAGTSDTQGAVTARATISHVPSRL